MTRDDCEPTIASFPALKHSVQVHSAPDVYEIKVPFLNVSTNATNCYVVVSQDDALVVDTGAPGAQGSTILLAALAELGLDQQRTQYFLTHLHLDHAGLVDDVVPAGATLYVSQVDFEASLASCGAGKFDQVRRLFMQEGISMSDASGFARYAIEPPLFNAENFNLVFAHDRKVIEVGNFCFSVVETPGHTPGHLALFEPESGILFGGDHVLFVISPGIALFPDGRDGLQSYLDSLEKIRELGATMLLVSHGEPRVDFTQRIDWLDEHHRERLKETVGIVGAQPGLTGDEIVRRIRWNVAHAAWEDISFVQKWCIINQGVVILNHLVDSGLIKRELNNLNTFQYFASK